LARFDRNNASQKKSTFAELEEGFRKKLFETWQESDGDKQFQSSYQALFLELEALLAERMPKAHNDNEKSNRFNEKGF
jgi:hypothetical protein